MPRRTPPQEHERHIMSRIVEDARTHDFAFEAKRGPSVITSRHLTVPTYPSTRAGDSASISTTVVAGSRRSLSSANCLTTEVEPPEGNKVDCRI